MNMRKLSINKACILLGTLLLLAVGAVCAAVYLLTQNITAVRCVFLFSLFVLLCVIFFVALIRRKLVRFSDAFCGQMDDMLSENMQPKQTTCEESLFYKINYRLGRLYEVMQENKNSIAKERTDLQELISDISHQVKTPIANLKMINNTLLENEVPPQKQKEFLTAQASQLDKLDFLMQAMIKTSRLETGVISLEQKQQPVYDTLAAALGGILLNAEKKQIDVQVECPEHLDARHDRKWTSEALFNILDNAVKYTPAGGQIRVSVEGWEMYVKIDIADTGIGISEQHQGTIFKRFYREDVVHDVDGIGIGLYLAREIVTLQGGYIRVASEVGKGSTFSVFLLRGLRHRFFQVILLCDLQILTISGQFLHKLLQLLCASISAQPVIQIFGSIQNLCVCRSPFAAFQKICEKDPVKLNVHITFSAAVHCFLIIVKGRICLALFSFDITDQLIYLGTFLLADLAVLGFLRQPLHITSLFGKNKICANLR